MTDSRSDCTIQFTQGLGLGLSRSATAPLTKCSGGSNDEGICPPHCGFNPACSHYFFNFFLQFDLMSVTHKCFIFSK